MQVLSQQVWAGPESSSQEMLRPHLEWQGTEASYFMAKTRWWVMKSIEWLVINI